MATLVVLTALSSFDAPAVGQSPMQSLQAHQLSSAPSDIAITPDGTKAVVRAGGSTDAILVVDVASGAILATFASNSAPGSAIDSVMVTNTRAIVLGAAGATDSVRFLDLSATPPVTLAIHSLASVPLHLAITPDGTKAVVRAGGSPSDAITVWDLATGAQLAAFASNSSPAGCTAVWEPVSARFFFDLGAMNAARATDTRAVVLGGAGATDSVRVLDLTTNPPTTLASHSLVSAPVDLAITPDGSKVVVRAGGSTDATSVISLATGAVLAQFPSNSAPAGFTQAPYLDPNGNMLAVTGAFDAVAVTDTRAIVLGAAGATDSVRIVDLAANPPVSMLTAGLNSAPVDLAITPDGSKAVVRSGGTPVDAITVWDLQNAALFQSHAWGSPPPVGDAVEVTDTRAVVLTHSEAVILDLGNGGILNTYTWVPPIRPVDLAITPDGTRAVVRSGGSPVDAIALFDLATGFMIHAIGSNGSPSGPLVVVLPTFPIALRGTVDAVEVTNTRAVVLGAAGSTDSIHTLALTAPPASSPSLFSLHGEVVHVVGEQVPPAAPGVTPAPGARIFAVGNFDSPSMDQNGTILYRARMTGGGSTPMDDRCYIMGRTGADLRMVVRGGDPAPGLPGFLLRSATANLISNPPRISPYGEILFFQSPLYDSVAADNPPTNADTALFWGPVGGISLLAREGDPVPATIAGSGEAWGPFLGSSELQHKQINANGAVLFGGQLVGGASTAANDGIIVSGTPTNLALVLREGESFPGGSVVAPAIGTTQLSLTMQMNQAGQVLHGINFSTTLGSPPATAANNVALGIWTPGAGQSTIVAREGDQVPGLAAGVIYAAGWAVNQGSACFTRSGKTALFSPISGPGITAGVNDYIVQVGGLAGWTIVMHKDDLCPGLGAGERFGVVGGLSLNVTDAGEVAFVTSLRGPGVTTANDSSLWIGSVDDLVLVAREGDACPGLPGYTFQAIALTNTPALRDGRCLLANLGVTDGVTPKTVLFGYTPQHGLRVVIDQTESVTTPAGVGTIGTLASNLGFNGSDGGHTMFDNQGDFTFRANLSVGTACIIRGHLGSLIARPSAVPVTGGVPHRFHVDFPAAQAGRLYAILATSLGTRPGFAGALFGWPHTVALNPDPLWTTVSIDNMNSSVWVNTLGLLDANGDGIGAASFVMPPGFPGFVDTTLHHVAFAFDVTNGIVVTDASEPSAVKLY